MYVFKIHWVYKQFSNATYTHSVSEMLNIWMVLANLVTFITSQYVASYVK